MKRNTIEDTGLINEVKRRRERWKNHLRNAKKECYEIQIICRQNGIKSTPEAVQDFLWTGDVIHLGNPEYWLEPYYEYSYKEATNEH